MAAGTKRFISVGVRLAVGTTLLVGLASTGAYVGLSHVARDALVAGKLESSRAVFRLFCQLITAPLIFDDGAGITEALGYLEQNEDVLYGRVLDEPRNGQESRLLGEYRRAGFREEMSRSLAATQRVVERRVELVEDVRDGNGAVLGHAMLILSLEKELSAFEVRRGQLLVASVSLAVALIVLLVSMLRARVVRPLGRLTHAAERLALGERFQLDLPESDEVGRLASAFDRMAATIEKRDRSLPA